MSFRGLTFKYWGAAVIDHAHFLQLGSFADVRQQRSSAFGLGGAQFGGVGVGLREVGGRQTVRTDAAQTLRGSNFFRRRLATDLTEGGGRRWPRGRGRWGRDGHPDPRLARLRVGGAPADFTVSAGTTRHVAATPEEGAETHFN